MDMQRVGEFDQHQEDDGSTVRIDYQRAIGRVIEISGSASQVRFDAAALNRQLDATDPSLAAGGQIGSQIKIRLGATWLIANVRTLKVDPDDAGSIIGHIDFLGEGDVRVIERDGRTLD